MNLLKKEQEAINELNHTFWNYEYGVSGKKHDLSILSKRINKNMENEFCENDDLSFEENKEEYVKLQKDEIESELENYVTAVLEHDFDVSKNRSYEIYKSGKLDTFLFECREIIKKHLHVYN